MVAFTVVVLPPRQDEPVMVVLPEVLLDDELLEEEELLDDELLEDDELLLDEDEPLLVVGA
jgi:hypothetical protein